MNKLVKYSLIITAAYEEKSIRKTIESIQGSNANILGVLEILVVSPDDATLEAAQAVIKEEKYAEVKYIKDAGQGKPVALNNALEKVMSNLVILTDGDMYLGDNALENLVLGFVKSDLGGVTGKVVSVDDKRTFFRY